MNISPQQLIQIISYRKIKDARLQIGAAVVATRRHYCSQMNVNNLCTRTCTNCQANLKAAAAKAEKAKLPDPTAAYIVGLRDQVAKTLEKRDEQKQPLVATNRFGEKDETKDLFAEFEAAL